MNISEAKKIRIVDYLRFLGHEPKKHKAGNIGIFPLSGKKRHLLSRSTTAAMSGMILHWAKAETLSTWASNCSGPLP